MSTPRSSDPSQSLRAPSAESASVDLAASAIDSSDFSWTVVGWSALIILGTALLVLFFDWLYINQLWVTVTALVPAFLVLHHGIYLLTFKRKFSAAVRATTTAAESTEVAGETAEDRIMHPRLIRQQLKKQALTEAEHEFGFQAIGLDYFLPMLLTAIAGLVPAFLFTHPEYIVASEGRENVNQLIRLPEHVYEAVRLGALGAWVYVALMLAGRTFLRDITPASALWSMVQLFLGPVLGGVVAVVWVGETQVNQMSHLIVYFFAGLGPRQMVDFIQATAQRFLNAGQPLPEVKLIPLQTVRGITQRIEDRLFEEGITDGYLLAMANPVRLYRNIPYDIRQIVSWMDECLLRVFAGEHVAALHKEGIVGAMDLANYWEMSDTDGVPAPDFERIEKLAGRMHLEKEMLEDLIRRLDEDDQVQLIWALYLATFKEISRDVRSPARQTARR